MENTISHTKDILKLNGEREERQYTAEILTEIAQNNKSSVTSIALGFTLSYLGMTNEHVLRFKLQVDFRYFLNDKNSAIQKLNKAQKLAATVAAINDTLEFNVNKNFKLLKVTNTDDIRINWMEAKRDILLKHPDLKDMANDFDWQLQEDHIQQLYLEDNFFSFLFSNIFYQEFDENKPLIEEKTISNGMGSLNIPIIEEKTLTKKDRAFTNVTIGVTAQLDATHKTFPLAKLNAFIGDLPTTPGAKYDLEFNYKGYYNVSTQLGLVTQAKLNYDFNIKDLYKKTTVITLNLENHE